MSTDHKAKSIDPDKIVRLNDVSKMMETYGLKRFGLFSFSPTELRSAVINAGIDGLDNAVEGQTDVYKYSDEFNKNANPKTLARGRVFVRAGWLIEQLEERGVKDPESGLAKFFNGSPMKLALEAIDICADHRPAINEGKIVPYVNQKPPTPDA